MGFVGSNTSVLSTPCVRPKSPPVRCFRRCDWRDEAFARPGCAHCLLGNGAMVDGAVIGGMKYEHLTCKDVALKPITCKMAWNRRDDDCMLALSSRATMGMGMRRARELEGLI